MDVKTFRDNLFQMNTRRFGTVAEIIIKQLTRSDNSINIHHDLDTDTGTKIEVKFSRVEKRHTTPITDLNVLDVVAREGVDIRMFPFCEWKEHKFSCNIQQLKRHEFDVLFYGIMFADRVLVFMAEPEEINYNMNYSNRQHKGNVGEGQFHISNSTLEYHLEHHLFATLSYKDILQLLGQDEVALSK